MNSCPKRRKWYALGGLVAVLLGMGRAEAAISGGGKLQKKALSCYDQALPCSEK